MMKNLTWTTLTIAKNCTFSERLLLIQYSIKKARGVGTVRSNDSTLKIKCSILKTCFFVYVSSVMYTNSPTSGGYISSYFLEFKFKKSKKL